METKNNEIRSVPSQGLALDLIRDLEELSNMNPDDYLFKSDKVDKPIIIAKSWNTATKKINWKILSLMTFIIHCVILGHERRKP